MTNFKFNLYGAGITVILILLSFVFNGILKVNFKNKYRTKFLDLNESPIKIGKNYLNSNNKKVIFKIQNNNFGFRNFYTNKITLAKEDFYSNSIYSLKEIIFKSVVLTNKKNWFLSNEILIKIFLFATWNFLAISLIMGFGIGIITGFSFFSLIFITDFFTTRSFYKQNCKKTQGLLEKIGVDAKDSRKILKFKKYQFIDKYISVFLESGISGFILFKKGGRDE